MHSIPKGSVSTAALIGAICCLAAGCMKPPPAKQATGPAPVRVVAVAKREVAQSIPAIGTVMPVEVSRVATGVAGLVEEVPVREGAAVKQNDLLAQLRTVRAEIEIAEAEATLAQKQQLLTEMEAGLRPEEVAQAEARMNSANAEANYSKTQAARIEELFARNNRTVTDRERDEAQYQAERTRQAYLEAKADYELKKSGNRVEQIAAAKATADAQQRVVERLQDDLKKMSIRAPFTGFVVVKQVEVGEWLPIGAPVVVVSRLDEVEVNVNIEESFIHEVSIGETVDVRFDALGGKSIPAVVREIVPRSQWAVGSRSFPVILRIQNTITDGRPLLSEGMVAKVQFRGTPHEALLAHKDAVVRTSGKPVVFVAEREPDGKTAKVRAVPVKEGISDGLFIEVTGDLADGDLLVTEGAEQLHPYDVVAIIDEPQQSVRTALSPTP